MGVKVRQWHPAIFIPRLKQEIAYTLTLPIRYKAYQNTLRKIMRHYKDIDCFASRVINRMDCGFECDYVEPYGFVPEDGCPIHDV